MNSNELIEGQFLLPLEQHYETKAKPGVRLTLLGELAGNDEATLISAVAFIKRTRKAMSFPSPAECLAAIKSCKAPPSASAVTGANYGQKVSEYGKASGREKFPVIQKWADADKKQMTPKWKAWLEYWENIDARSTLALVYERDSWTVPTDWPYQFDASARWSVGDPEGQEDAA